MYADFAMQAHKYEEAYEHAVRSHDLAKLSGAMTAWVASSLYYMGNIRLCQGKASEAVYVLRRGSESCGLQFLSSQDPLG